MIQIIVFSIHSMCNFFVGKALWQSVFAGILGASVLAWLGRKLYEIFKRTHI